MLKLDESCYTEDWSNGYWKFSFTIKGINYNTLLKTLKKHSSQSQIFSIDSETNEVP